MSRLREVLGGGVQVVASVAALLALGVAIAALAPFAAWGHVCGKLLLAAVDGMEWCFNRRGW